MFVMKFPLAMGVLPRHQTLIPSWLMAYRRASKALGSLPPDIAILSLADLLDRP